MGISKEARDALEELIRMMAKYGASNFRFDVGGASEAPPDQRLQAFDAAVQRMHAEAPSVLANLASMPKDPYYQAMYGLAELSGQRLGEAGAMESAAISQLAGATERGVVPPERALALAQAYEKSEAIPPLPMPQGDDSESAAQQYLERRQRLLHEAARPVAELIRARSEAAAMGDDTGAEMADQWIKMLSEAVANAGAPVTLPKSPAPEEETPEEGDSEVEKRRRFLERIRKLRERLRNLY